MTFSLDKGSRLPARLLFSEEPLNLEHLLLGLLQLKFLLLKISFEITLELDRVLDLLLLQLMDFLLVFESLELGFVDLIL